MGRGGIVLGGVFGASAGWTPSQGPRVQVLLLPAKGLRRAKIYE